jgi:hypothetical protein
MEYTNDFYMLKSIFRSDISEILIPGSPVKIVNENFISDIDVNDFMRQGDYSISENLEFSYPIFIPENPSCEKVILFLHGLNERSWIKYLVWAYWISVVTESYVVLFPISFHINRSPSSWVDPRSMQSFVDERNGCFQDVTMSSFANVALSKRLSEEPMRFFNSGYQTAFDIVKLVRQIKNGTHHLLPRTGNVNIFAYSIGAFLAQILMMGNPEQLFTGSRLFMFCGGSVFCRMNGTSRLIMDSMAYNRVYSYFLNDFEKGLKNGNPFSEFLRSTQIGLAFRSMIDLGRLKSFREQILARLRHQIRSVALKKDTVIPAEAIVSTLKREAGHNVEVWDFPYSYSHENPFPVNIKPSCSEVDNSFTKLINAAASFLG